MGFEACSDNCPSQYELYALGAFIDALGDMRTFNAEIRSAIWERACRFYEEDRTAGGEEFARRYSQVPRRAAEAAQFGERALRWSLTIVVVEADINAVSCTPDVQPCRRLMAAQAAVQRIRIEEFEDRPPAND